MKEKSTTNQRKQIEIKRKRDRLAKIYNSKIAKMNRDRISKREVREIARIVRNKAKKNTKEETRTKSKKKGEA